MEHHSSPSWIYFNIPHAWWPTFITLRFFCFFWKSLPCNQWFGKFGLKSYSNTHTHTHTHLSSLSLSLILQVQTYDGLAYAFQGSSCWVTATILADSISPTLRSEVYNDLQMAVQVRFTDQWEVRLTAPSYAVVIDMTRSDIWVSIFYH